MAFQISLNGNSSEFHQKYTEGVKLDKHYEVCLKNFVTYNTIPNISEENKNNTLSLSKPYDNTSCTLVIPTGTYELDHIISLIEITPSFKPANITLSLNKNTFKIKIYSSWIINFACGNSIGPTLDIREQSVIPAQTTVYSDRARSNAERRFRAPYTITSSFREAAPPPRGTNQATDPVWLLGPAKCAGSWSKLVMERGNIQENKNVEPKKNNPYINFSISESRNNNINKNNNDRGYLIGKVNSKKPVRNVKNGIFLFCMIDTAAVLTISLGRRLAGLLGDKVDSYATPRAYSLGIRDNTSISGGTLVVHMSCMWAGSKASDTSRSRDRDHHRQPYAPDLTRKDENQELPSDLHRKQRIRLAKTIAKDRIRNLSVVSPIDSKIPTNMINTPIVGPIFKKPSDITQQKTNEKSEQFADRIRHLIWKAKEAASTEGEDTEYATKLTENLALNRFKNHSLPEISKFLRIKGVSTFDEAVQEAIEEERQNGEIICLGIIYLPIIIYGEEYDFKFHVVRQQDIGKMDKGILGYNILQATKAQINLEKMILNFTTLNAYEKIYSLNNEEIHSCLNNIDEHSTHSISLISDGQKAHTESNIIEQSPQTNSNFSNEQKPRQIEPKKVSKILDGQSTIQPIPTNSGLFFHEIATTYDQLDDWILFDTYNISGIKNHTYDLRNSISTVKSNLIQDKSVNANTTKDTLTKMNQLIKNLQDLYDSIIEPPFHRKT
ncbi:hypothetical protein PGB90_001175 [Kerria lacca]